jgi:nicotinate-nucleotide pyrophosphorylase (carboxylating)
MQSKTAWQLNDIDNQLIDLALKEDLQFPYNDVTTETLFAGTPTLQSVQIICKHPSEVVIAGLPVVDAILKRLNANFTIITTSKDGDILHSGETLLQIQSDAASLLKAERTILNFLRHLCAVATLTRKFVDLVKNTQLKILDTRKTIPGMRHLEKYAVHCGGGVNHRMGLYDAFMIKDNHIDLIGDIRKALAVLPLQREHNLPVIVEVRNLAELQLVLKYGRDKITRVLLDNMQHEQLKQCVKQCQGIVAIEASGNINLQNIVAIANTGVDYASIGMLTYAAGHVDLSMISGN